MKFVVFKNYQMSDMNTASSSNDLEKVLEVKEKQEEVNEPEAKKAKTLDLSSKTDKLDQRLGGIFCCPVCLDLPVAAVYQCSNGHLMCVGCLTHLLADARQRDGFATCPTCRVQFSKATASRNRAVEKAVSELPFECRFCLKEYPKHSLGRHEESECDERVTSCKYSEIGCPWSGPNNQCLEHEKICVVQKRTGAEIMEALQIIKKKSEEEKQAYENLQLKPYYTDGFIDKFFYETSRFYAYEHCWLVRARINNFESDPVHSSEREMAYQEMYIGVFCHLDDWEKFMKYYSIKQLALNVR